MDGLTFQYEGLCQLAVTDAAMKAAGEDGFTQYKRHRNYAGDQSDEVKDFPLQKAGIDYQTPDSKPDRHMEINLPEQFDFEFTETSLGDVIRKRGLVILRGFGLMAQDSFYNRDFNSDFQNNNIPDTYRYDHHSKIVFSVGAVEDIATDFSVTADEFHEISGFTKSEKVVVAFDMDHSRETPQMEKIFYKAGLPHEKLHTLPPETLSAMGAGRVMLSIAPLEAMLESFQPIHTSILYKQGSDLEMAPISWPNDEMAKALLKKAPKDA